MTFVNRPPLVGIAICVYCMWQSINLLYAWTCSPYDRFGWVSFLIWCAPVFLFWTRQSKICHISPARPIFLALGLFFAFHGLAGSIHVLQHIGLALAVAGLMPSVRLSLLWLFSSLSWMPALGWLSGRFFPDYVQVVRFSMVIFPAFWMVYNIYHTPRRQT